MSKSIRSSVRAQLGQGMTEYIIIVALIAIAAIGVYSFFGQSIRGQTAGMAQEMAGGKAQEGQNIAKTAADSAKTSAAASKSLGTYGNEQK
ncbi:MAG: pilus assembly protein [Betaproteobacteria bacterium]|nr:pilus assembly protein [Betaproteobacteria bacterium]